MINNLISNPIVQCILALITIVSLIYAIYCQKKNQVRKEFSYAKKTSVIIYNNQKNKYKKLNVLYDGNEIQNLCVSKIAIWNSGNRMLNKGDIVEDKKLLLSMENDGTFLESTIIFESEESNKFRLNRIDEKKIEVEFDYVEAHSGIVLQVIYSGEIKDLQLLSCKIKEGKPLKKYSQEYHAPNRAKKTRLLKRIYQISLLVVYFALGLFISCTGIWRKEHPRVVTAEMLERMNTNNEEIVSLIIMGIFTMICSVFLSIIWIRDLKIGIPSDLKKIYMDEDDIYDA